MNKDAIAKAVEGLQRDRTVLVNRLVNYKLKSPTYKEFSEMIAGIDRRVTEMLGESDGLFFKIMTGWRK